MEQIKKMLEPTFQQMHDSLNTILELDQKAIFKMAFWGEEENTKINDLIINYYDLEGYDQKLISRIHELFDALSFYELEGSNQTLINRIHELFNDLSIAGKNFWRQEKTNAEETSILVLKPKENF